MVSIRLLLSRLSTAARRRCAKGMALALTLSVGLIGCSSVKLGYNHAPALLQFQMDRYLDLNDTQEALLSKELEAFQAWHRQAALPDYARTLRQWAKKLDQPHTFTVDELLTKQAVFEDALMVVAERSAYRLAPLVLTLTPKQQDRLRERFKESNEEYAEENLEDNRRAEKERLERYTDRYEEWLGPLTKGQEATLSTWLARQPSRAQLWGQERLARQEALMNLLSDARDMPSAEQAAVSLHDYFQSLSRYRVSDLQNQREARLRDLSQLTADMLNSMTPRQREHLKETLLEYASDFESLSK